MAPQILFIVGGVSKVILYAILIYSYPKTSTCLTFLLFYSIYKDFNAWAVDVVLLTVFEDRIYW